MDSRLRGKDKAEKLPGLTAMGLARPKISRIFKNF
jgi:hypothetical protein